MHQNWDLAVITSDFVDSTKLSSNKRKRLSVLVSDAVVFLMGEKQNFQIFRGDSFQIRVPDPAYSLSIAMGLRVYFKAFGAKEDIPNLDARVSIGVGGETLHRVAVGKSDGEAYRLSGLGLDAMPMQQLLAIHLENTTVPYFWDTLALFLDDILSNLTQAQAEALLWAFKGKNQEEIAHALNISQAAVNQRLKSAKFALIKQSLHCFESYIGTNK